MRCKAKGKRKREREREGEGKRDGGLFRTHAVEEAYTYM